MTIRRILNTFATLLAAAVLLSPIAEAAQATLEGNVLKSRDFPVGSIAVDHAFSYVGTTEFVLYGVANAEIHVFAELDGKRAKRLYWIQFESYLPDNRHVYNYSKDPLNVTLGGHKFHERASFATLETPPANMRKGSDREAVQKLLDAKGYTLAPEVVNLRMVRLDETARRELMIIYSEARDPQGLKAADFAEGGKAFGQRDAIFEGVRQRATAGLKMDMK